MKAIFTLTAALAFAMAPLLTSGFNGFRPTSSRYRRSTRRCSRPAMPSPIWGLIYLWLLAGAVFGLLTRAEAPGWDAARWPLIASLVSARRGSRWRRCRRTGHGADLGDAGHGALGAHGLRPDDRPWLRTPSRSMRAG